MINFHYERWYVRVTSRLPLRWEDEIESFSRRVVTLSCMHKFRRRWHFQLQRANGIRVAALCSPFPTDDQFFLQQRITRSDLGKLIFNVLSCMTYFIFLYLGFHKKVAIFLRMKVCLIWWIHFVRLFSHKLDSIWARQISFEMLKFELCMTQMNKLLIRYGNRFCLYDVIYRAKRIPSLFCGWKIKTRRNGKGKYDAEREVVEHSPTQ